MTRTSPGGDRAASVLHAETDDGVAQLTARMLRRHVPAIEVRRAMSAEEVLELLEHDDVDCVISEHRLPDRTGVELLREIRDDHDGVPFVLFTGGSGGDLLEAAFGAGAEAVVEKRGGREQYVRLAHRVERAIRRGHGRSGEAVPSSASTELLGDSSTAVALWGPESTLAWANERARSVLGVPDPRGTPLADFVVEDDLDAVLDRIEEANAAGVPGEVHARVEAGEEGPSRVTLDVAPVPTGGFVTFIREPPGGGEGRGDIERERDRLASLIETIPEPVVQVRMEDGEPIIRAVNPAYEMTFGHSAEEAIGRSNNELVVPRDRREEARAFDRRALEGETVTAEVVREAIDGERHFIVRVVPVGGDDADRHEEHFVTYVDITDRKERERALESLHDVATSIQQEGTVERVCERTVAAAAEILDFHLCAVLLRDGNWLEPVATSDEAPPDGARRMGIDQGLAGTTLDSGQGRIVHDVREDPDADPADASFLSGLSVQIGDHGVFQAVGTEVGAFDRTDLELAELLVTHTAAALDRIDRERALERQNERLDAFASVISHDLRNPLSVAEGYLDLLEGDPDPEYVDAVRAAHRRITDILDDTHALAVLGGEAAEATDEIRLEPFVEECWSMVDPEGASVTVDTDATILGDRTRLRQVFENLFDNAVTHGGPGVTVTVGTDGEEGLYVEDDGPGIPAGERDDVFSPGYTTGDENTGFGLAIVREIVEALGWEIGLSEGTSGGTRFEITGVEVVSSARTGRTV